MKYLLPILFSLPTAVLVLHTLFGPILFSFFDFAPSNETEEWPPRPSSIQALFVFLPFLGFAASLAMIFVKPNVREWKIAAIFTGLPIALLFAMLTIFWILGIEG